MIRVGFVFFLVSSLFSLFYLDLPFNGDFGLCGEFVTRVHGSSLGVFIRHLGKNTSAKINLGGLWRQFFFYFVTVIVFEFCPKYQILNFAIFRIFEF